MVDLLLRVRVSVSGVSARADTVERVQGLAGGVRADGSGLVLESGGGSPVAAVEVILAPLGGDHRN